jgi:hypothetical protein
MIWEHNILFNKARFYILKAEEQENNNTLRPLLYSFALELLCKSSLSYIHPTLIADPQDEGQSLMYALGLPNKGQPKSLPAHSIYKRIQQLIDPFLDFHLTFCEYFSSKRNEELHSGESPMSTMQENEWLPRFYNVANILCLSMKKELKDLVGEGMAVHALELISSSDKNEEDSIRKKIGSHKSVFLSKSNNDKASLSKLGEHYTITSVAINSEVVGCPACSCPALIFGREVQQKEPKYNGETFYAEVIYQTSNLICKCCGLELRNQKEIIVVNIQIRFVKSVALDLHEFYHPEQHPEYDNM